MTREILRDNLDTSKWSKCIRHVPEWFAWKCSTQICIFQRSCLHRENSDKIPEHRSVRMRNMRTSKSGTQFTNEETKNLQKTANASKVANRFTRALASPFIGRRRDFYIPKIPSNLRNISSVNMYMNVFYIPWFTGLISYIYKSATSSHIKPGLLR
jgi:hypothetical protein